MWSPLLLPLLLAPLLLLLRPASGVVTLDRNGYRGVTVAIHTNVAEDGRLVDNIKQLFEHGSSFLYEATRHRAYFNEVTIVVPAEWQHLSQYEVVRPSNRFASADIRVDLPNGMYGDAPYTLQPGECGEAGDYIHLTPDFVRSLAKSGASAYGDPGRALVHEWAHLRYGVFDEHGYQHDARTPTFYVDEHGEIRYTACTSNVPGWMRDEVGGPCRRRQDGLPDDDCLFYPDVEKATAKASLMSMPYLPTVEGFCDNTEERKHNALAPNMHNLMCQGKSTWDVLMDHPDFVRNRNAPREDVHPTPFFRVVQPKKNDNPAYVLVLDVSQSMRGRRMELLHKAAARFIKYQLRDYSALGMVAFHTDVQVLSNMTQLDKLTRDILVDKVPSKEDIGYTAIGQGLLEGLKLLRVSREPTDGALLLLVTDGEENVGPKLEEVLSQIVETRVTINTIAFGPDASQRLESLVKATGGRGFFFDDRKVGHKALDSAFLESATTQADVELQPVEVINSYWVVEKGEQVESNFTLDKEIGTNTVLRLTYDFPTTVDLTLVSPAGKKYDSRAAEYTDDAKTNTISIELPHAQPGLWIFYVHNRQVFEQDVSVTVTSEPRDIREQPIRVRAWVADVDLTFPAQAKVYAEVKKDYNAIVDASVIATIDGPGGDPHIMMLYDNGGGADVTPNDGIYSGFFTNFNGSGRYSVEAVVLNNGKARMKLGSEGSPAPRFLRHLSLEQVHGEASQSAFDMDALLPPTAHAQKQEQYSHVDSFERSVTAGSFRLQNWTEGDHIPPSRILDLHVIMVEPEDRVVFLRWTSTGGDMDSGTASRIDLRLQSDALVLLHTFDDAWVVGDDDLVHGSLSDPPASGQPHSVQVRVPPGVAWSRDRPTLFFALRAVDAAGNLAHPSNIATATMPPPHRKRDDDDDEPAAPPDRGGAQEEVSWLPVALAIGAAVLVIVAIFAILAYIRYNRRKQKYRCKCENALLT